MLRKNIYRVLFLLGLLFSFAAKAQTVEELFHQKGDPVIGQPKSDVTVVEFFDYQCGHCMNMASVIDAIRKNNPDVRIVFKDYPIRGPISEYAARAALAAQDQGKYYEFSHALLTANQALTPQSVMAIAKKIGLNVNKLKKDMDSPAITNQLNANIKLAEKLKLRGTPAFFFGKTNGGQLNYVLGEMTQREMQDAIDKTKD